jgi:hypothetical protein
MVPFLDEQLRRPPTDRLADAFLHYGDLEHGAQALDAYDKFIQLLDDEEERGLLSSLGPTEARASQPFRTAAELGSEIDDGLLGLLFGPALSRWTRSSPFFSSVRRLRESKARRRISSRQVRRLQGLPTRVERGFPKARLSLCVPQQDGRQMRPRDHAPSTCLRRSAQEATRSLGLEACPA